MLQKAAATVSDDEKAMEPTLVRRL
jgi:hypothetical protein